MAHGVGEVAVVQESAVDTPLGIRVEPVADDAGRPVAAGAYAIKASSSVGDNAAALPVRLAARVDSVSIEPTGLTLNLSGLGGFALGSVRRIS